MGTVLSLTYEALRNEKGQEINLTLCTGRLCLFPGPSQNTFMLYHQFAVYVAQNSNFDIYWGIFNLRTKTGVVLMSKIKVRINILCCLGKK